MSALAFDLNEEFTRIRIARRETRKRFAIVTGIPAKRQEKIDRHECGVSLETLHALSALPEGKRLVARIFGLDVQTPNELHALLTRAQEIIGGRT
jgi:hypothetical protein